MTSYPSRPLTNKPSATGVRIAPAPKQKRVLRSPEHPFLLKHRPFQIQPFCIAPVLPGETLENLLLQSRAVTDPVLNPLIGWWLEHYYFYVPLRTIDGINVANIEAMLLDQTAPLSSTVATSVPFYQLTADGGVDWVSGCLDTVVKHYFRDTAETGSTHDLDGVPQAHLNQNGAFDSYYTDAEKIAMSLPDDHERSFRVMVTTDPFYYTNNTMTTQRLIASPSGEGAFAGTELSVYDADDVYSLAMDTRNAGSKDGVDVVAGFLEPGCTLKLTTVQEGTAGCFFDVFPVTNGVIDNGDDNEGKYKTWLLLKQEQMTTLTYEDYLATFGVRKKEDVVIKPELIRFVRDWTYPSNTIDPTNGTPRSALSWSVTERADKNRFFREPGFIFGVTVARPKVYLSKQTTFTSSVLNDCLSWLPALMKDRVETSLRKFVADTGPLSSAQSVDYWLDIKDLFIHGDQFVNIALSSTGQNLVALPGATHEASRYVPDADIDALFVTPGVDSATAMVKQDGITKLSIMGTQMDYTGR